MPRTIISWSCTCTAESGKAQCLTFRSSLSDEASGSSFRVAVFLSPHFSLGLHSLVPQPLYVKHLARLSARWAWTEWHLCFFAGNLSEPSLSRSLSISPKDFLLFGVAVFFFPHTSSTCSANTLSKTLGEVKCALRRCAGSPNRSTSCQDVCVLAMTIGMGCVIIGAYNIALIMSHEKSFPWTKFSLPVVILPRSMAPETSFSQRIPLHWLLTWFLLAHQIEENSCLWWYKNTVVLLWWSNGLHLNLMYWNSIPKLHIKIL